MQDAEVQQFYGTLWHLAQAVVSLAYCSTRSLSEGNIDETRGEFSCSWEI